jgi:hypothetical protein
MNFGITTLADCSHETLRRISDYLVAAGDYMAEHHKCAGVAGTPDGRVCAWGAICKVTPVPSTEDGYVRSWVASALSEYLGVSCIPDWSDKSAENVVVQAFYDAATKCRPDATTVSGL